MSFELGEGRITVNSDFNGTERKSMAVVLAHIFSPGTDMPSDLDPHSGEVVTVALAPDANPQSFQRICEMAQFTVRHS